MYIILYESVFVLRLQHKFNTPVNENDRRATKYWRPGFNNIIFFFDEFEVD